MLVFSLLFTTLGAYAEPSAKEAEKLVKRIVSWSLVKQAGQMGPGGWPVYSNHAASFDPEFFELLKWTSVRHKDAEGQERWLYEVDPLWQTQGSAIVNVRTGSAQLVGDRFEVIVDYTAPSPLSAERPSSRHHSVWEIKKKDGKLLLSDIRYRIKAPTGTRQGRVSTDIQEAQARAR